MNTISKSFIGIILLNILIIVPGCKKHEQTHMQKVVQPAPPVSPADQEAFKQKLHALGIPVYKGASFVEVKRKSADNPMLMAVYDVQDPKDREYDNVRKFYAGKLKGVLGRKGWVEAKSDERLVAYRKDFEVLVVEFSRVIGGPGLNRVRIAIQYGK